MQRIGKQIRITVSFEMDDKVGEIAKRLKTSKANIYRNMTGVGLDLYSDFEKVGLVKLVEFVEKARDAGQKYFIKGKQPSLF